MPFRDQLVSIAGNLAIDTWRAEFSSAIAERAYRRISFSDSIQTVRWALWIGIVIIWVPSYSDFVLTAGAWPYGIALIARIGLSAFFGYILLMGRNIARRKQIERLLVPFVIISTSFIIMISATRPPNYWVMIIQNLGFTYALYLFTPLDLRRVAITLVVGNLAYLASTFSRGGFTSPEMATISVTFIVANFFGFITARRLNTLRRIEFAKRLEDSRARRRLRVEILERIRIEQKLKFATEQAQTARQAAEQANQAKSLFLAAMSHEIRTPLTGILGFTHLLAHSKLDQEQLMQLQLIERCGVNLQRLLDDILDISRVESGRIQIVASPFDLIESITTVLALIQERSASLNSQISFYTNMSGPLWLMGDSTRICQILANLLDNALKFSSGKPVNLDLFVSQANHEAAIQIVVSDQGPGIPQDHRATIFEPYVTSPNAGPSGRGAGLGLAICKRLIDAMSGLIHFEDREGGGTAFKVELIMPLAVSEHLHTDQDDEPTGTQTRRRLNVLLVDDDEVNRILIETFVSKLGHDVCPEIDGRRGVEMARGREFDLILMDIWMPIMSGLEAIEAIRTNGGLTASHVPIIVMTANMMDDNVTACQKAGADEILAKPIDFALLKSKINGIASLAI